MKHFFLQKILMVLLVVLFFSSCIGNKYSYKVKNEKAFIKFQHYSADRNLGVIASIIPGKPEAGAKSRGLAFALPYIFKFASSKMVKFINKDKAKYIQEYTTKASDDMFYTSDESDADINLKDIKIIRTFKSEKHGTDTALIMTLGVEQSSDGYFLRFITKDLDIRYTKAKLLLNDKTVDIQLNMNMIAFWFDGNKQHMSEKIADVSFIYKDIPLRKKMPKNELDIYKSPWFPAVPRTAFNSNKFGTGNYLINAMITEYDDMDKRTTMKPNTELPKGENLLNNLLQGIKK